MASDDFNWDAWNEQRPSRHAVLVNDLQYSKLDAASIQDRQDQALAARERAGQALEPLLESIAASPSATRVLSAGELQAIERGKEADTPPPPDNGPEPPPPDYSALKQEHANAAAPSKGANVDDLLAYLAAAQEVTNDHGRNGR